MGAVRHCLQGSVLGDHLTSTEGLLHPGPRTQGTHRRATCWSSQGATGVQRAHATPRRPPHPTGHSAPVSAPHEPRLCVSAASENGLCLSPRGRCQEWPDQPPASSARHPQAPPPQAPTPFLTPIRAPPIYFTKTSPLGTRFIPCLLVFAGITITPRVTAFKVGHENHASGCLRGLFSRMAFYLHWLGGLCPPKTQIEGARAAQLSV